ncbi:hypothetical protein ACFVY0_44820 [Streptomyces sp. NPDC058286]|uniref:hypothetical protein n=1 Tax=Streptomyces sp. NPDC058286 TaxID=3346422 RepID=UPI0036E18FC2
MTALADQLRQRTAALSQVLTAAEPHLTGVDSPLLRGVQLHMAVCTPTADAWDPRIVQPGAQPLPPMTHARYASMEMVANRVPLRAAGMLQRALAPIAAAQPLRVDLQKLINDWCAQCEDSFEGAWLPVARQVEQNIATILAAIDLARTR